MQSIDREILFAGPVRTGKSRACLEKIHYLCMANPGCRVLLLRQTRRSLAQSIIQTFERDVLTWDAIVGGESRGGKENRYSYRYINGSEIVLGGLDDPAKFLSSEYDIIYIAQAEECYSGILEVLKTRLSNFRLPFQQLIMDANPRAPSHWLKKRCEAGHTVYLPARWQDNPRYCTGTGAMPPPGLSQHWDGLDWTPSGLELLRKAGWTKEGIAYLALQWNAVGHQFDRLILGKWCSPEGARFKGASRNSTQGFNLHEEFPHGIPSHWPRWLSGDYGKADPYCCLWHCLTPDGVTLTYQEDYTAGFEADQQADRIIGASPDNDLKYLGIYLDQSMRSSQSTFGAQQKGKKWIPAVDLYRAKFDETNRFLGRNKFGPILSGAQNREEEAYVTLDMMLRTGKWRIERSCVNLWNEIEDAVHYRDPATGIWSEQINPGGKKYCADHALEAAGYGLHKRQPFKDTLNGDIIDFTAIRVERMVTRQKEYERSKRKTDRPRWARR